ncbi:carbohydrate ABC transporter permease [Brachyspira hampsonii]|uniref:carbohydrate ABC transporter permease n=1 Tax=Brachyspira hampsonii TaxID=1287055 RepID=UPI000344CD63|nr:carbohydrate ABC transporter permease [Brachyspira hampsonii]
MRQNFHSVPDTLIEAARIDGANEWTIFAKIVMPLMIPALTALGIYMFVAEWTNFTWPLIILNSPEKFTLPVALSQLKSDTRIDYGQIMVGAIFAVVPIMAVFLALQKYFISGLTGGSVKE